ncbi:MAG: cytochrome [Parcubacteria group bacterium CG08_land_8_20_14_0_20_48_21]|nr:MAG: hypothetical protein AUK21_01130 [Parcubacteria group bacterium CG2_30_48_51]PIS33135.1 MAG: cytochrome [Parcubacteria group bacterium CG08_land_8_20_14_0_20_48_21]PIW79348.1 MAG: cytochrome [Parcubacteria group bacterium CG_4_8_14_3_um_filter_48_16]PIY78402.1 MAG: cytochrome [Parcubacteria group bacterium CG_4_10_14_0_8_um_filter_48_154]PIZ76854.1 MAG: cytochrome [bacterium CG_4_10_14_0_2_um_filter_48_144]PJC39656.1 MAG: cytochrome [Parcubacteria group bacterium CG_4_9_14_0_2_um_filte
MATYKIEVDRDACISISNCVAIAPNVFQLDDEGKAYVVKTDGDLPETILEAAKSCPVDAIILKDEQGKQIWPEK